MVIRPDALAEEAKAAPKLRLGPMYPPNARWIHGAQSADNVSRGHSPLCAQHRASEASPRARISGDFASGLLVGKLFERGEESGCGS